ncbi:MAG TPA: GAF and ANTAR domain-containing protein [Propionibacteriaceae bacterium]
MYDECLAVHAANSLATGPIAELSKIPFRELTLLEVLHRVAELCKQTVTDVADVSITFVVRNKPRTVAFTSPLAVHLDERQYATGRGPCTDAAISERTITMDHTRANPSYPEFTRDCVRAGITHTVSIGMPISTERSAGAINLYATTPGALTPTGIQSAQLFADYAAVTLDNAAHFRSAVDEARHLHLAMQSRAVIEQAKGIIMAQTQCSADEALTVLVKRSQDQHLKLRDVAADVVGEYTDTK